MTLGDHDESLQSPYMMKYMCTSPVIGSFENPRSCGFTPPPPLPDDGEGIFAVARGAAKAGRAAVTAALPEPVRSAGPAEHAEAAMPTSAAAPSIVVVENRGAVRRRAFTGASGEESDERPAP